MSPLLFKTKKDFQKWSDRVSKIKSSRPADTGTAKTKKKGKRK